MALVFFGLLAFINALHHPFVHDDIFFILKNPHITQLNTWWQAFQMPMVADGLNAYYRPLLEVFYRLEYHFFGADPLVYHLVNVLVHIANGLLLFGLLQRLGLGRAVAWVVALLFLVHPVQTEAVDCISGISNLLMACGILSALHAYLDKRYGRSMLFFIAAFLCKEQAVLFLPLVMVVDCSRGEKPVSRWLMLSMAVVLLLAWRHMVTGASLYKEITASPKEFYLRLAAIPRDLEMYARLVFFPYDLHYYRNTDILQPNGRAWILFLVFATVFMGVFRRLPQMRPTLVLGSGWFLACLLPVLNIVPLVDEYSFIMTPEHFLYLPIVGVLIIVVVAVDHAARMEIDKKVLLGLALGVCLLVTWHQNTFWQSETVLFERMLRFEPDFARGHLLLAQAYSGQGRYREADPHFQKAYTIMSGYVRKATNARPKHFYLGYVDKILFDWSQNDKLY